MGARKILHLDLDAFFCSVEELRREDLRGVPFAVGGQPDERGVISSCSYAARQFGVHSAMPTAHALRLCPQLQVLPSDFASYRLMSGQVMAILHEVSPLVEQLSIDEAFIDASDLPQTGLALAEELQSAILQRCKLPCSLGVATNKLLAKTATDVGKGRHRAATPPNAIEVVPPGQEAAYLAPLPVRALWGVGPKTAARLEELGLRTIGDLTKLPVELLERNFGAAGREMSRHARGIDERPVSPERSARSISQEVTFDRDVGDGAALQDTLRLLSEGVGRQLREKGMCAATVRIKLRWPDFTTLTRQVSLDQPADQDGVIYKAAQELFQRVWQEGKRVRLLGVGASRLSEQAHQLGLWDTPAQKEHRLLDAIDTLRERFGDEAVVSGRRLKQRKNDKS
jgi:DNA polymerase-4